MSGLILKRIPKQQPILDVPMQLIFQRLFVGVALFFCLVAVSYVGYFFVLGLSSPRIVCNLPSHDFGTVYLGDDVTHVFTLKNVGNRPLQIQSAQSSCSGCLEVLEYTKGPIAPSEQGQVMIRLLPEKLLGQVNKQVIVFSNDPRQPVLPLDVVALVLRKKEPIVTPPLQSQAVSVPPDGVLVQEF